MNRRDLAASGGALLAASLTGSPAEARVPTTGLLYGHGLVWNRALRGVPGELQLAFELAVDLDAGTGRGSAVDPVHPDWSLHFELDSVQAKKRPRGEVRYLLAGKVTEAANPDSVDLPVRIIAETNGDATAIAIRLGDLAFAGAGLEVKAPSPLVLALIRILIGR